MATSRSRATSQTCSSSSGPTTPIVMSLSSATTICSLVSGPRTSSGSVDAGAPQLERFLQQRHRDHRHAIRRAAAAPARPRRGRTHPPSAPRRAARRRAATARSRRRCARTRSRSIVGARRPRLTKSRHARSARSSARARSEARKQITSATSSARHRRRRAAAGLRPHLRVDRSGADAVHAHAVLLHLDRQRLGHRDHRRLATRSTRPSPETSPVRARRRSKRR